MDVCTYLTPLDEKEVQRNWLFLEGGLKENRGGKWPPTSGSSFDSALPSLQILQPSVWKELLGWGGVVWGG